MMVKSKKEAIGFDVSKVAFKGYKAIGDVKVGDTVAAKYSKEGVKITNVKEAPAAKKAEKPARKAPKKEESKPAPAPEKKPAEAPAKK